MGESNANGIVYALRDDVGTAEAGALWKSSGFFDYAPDFDWREYQDLLKNSDIVVTARDNKRLIGMTRAVTDYYLYCGLVDIMVDANYTRHGIGRELAIRTRDAAGEKAWLVAVADSEAAKFYKHSGFTKVDEAWSAWILTPQGTPDE